MGEKLKNLLDQPRDSKGRWTHVTETHDLKHDGEGNEWVYIHRSKHESEELAKLDLDRHAERSKTNDTYDLKNENGGTKYLKGSVYTYDRKTFKDSEVRPRK